MEAQRQDAHRSHCILLVEDSPADVMLVREALAEYGVTCDLVVMQDGEAAIRRIEEIEASRAPCPELVILDLNLPKKSGYEVLERVRASKTCAQTPVIVLSSSDAPSDKARAMALGSTRYLSKPPDFDDFLNLGAIFKQFLASSSR